MDRGHFVLGLYSRTIVAGTIFGLIYLLSGILPNELNSNFWAIIPQISPVAMLSGAVVFALKILRDVSGDQRDINNNINGRSNLDISDEGIDAINQQVSYTNGAANPQYSEPVSAENSTQSAE